MKGKLNLDGAAVQAWFLLHGEKLGLALFTVLTGLVIWGAIDEVPFAKIPNDLSNQVVQFRRQVDQASWDPETEGVALPKPPFATQIGEASKPIDPTPFAWATLLNPPLFENKERRGEPKYLPLATLRAAYSEGAIEKRGDKEYFGDQWAVITGLVPYEDQLVEYERQFRNAIFVDPNRDHPQYIDMIIERAEVQPGQAVADLKWQPLDLQASFKYWQDFSNNYPRVVPRNQELAMPDGQHRVPPILGREPEPIYAHEPEIPFVLQQAEQGTAANDASNTPTGPQRPGRNDPVQAAARAQAEQEQAAAAAAAAQERLKPPKYKLFRFCDFTVERLRTYVYRVKLVLANPNERVAPQHLKDHSYAQGTDRVTDWSPVSNPVRLPRDFQLAVAEMRPGVAGFESAARISVRRFEPNFGAIVEQVFGDLSDRTSASERTYVRGSWLNFESVVGKYTNARGEVKDGQVNFITDSMLVGILGGDRPPVASGSPLNYRAPAEVAIVGPDGRLSIHSQLTQPTANLPAVVPAATSADPATPGAPTGAPAGSEAPAPPKVNPLAEILKLPGK